MYEWIEVLPGIGWSLMALLTVLVLEWDKRSARERASRSKAVDFQERGLRPYLIGAFLLGPLVLLPYFWFTRKSARGLAWGLAALAGISVVTWGVTSVGGGVLWSAYQKEVHQACNDPGFPDRTLVCEVGSMHLYEAGIISGDEEQELLASGCLSGDDMLCMSIAPGFDPDDVRKSLYP